MGLGRDRFQTLSPGRKARRGRSHSRWLSPFF
jgi:hypothetical protein